MRGKTFSLTPADCERDLYIRAKDACGTAESFFVIPCQVTNYYYDVNVALGEVAIGVVKTDNAEVNAILTAQKAKQAVVFNAATDVKIKSVVVYTENRQVLYSKEYAMGVGSLSLKHFERNGSAASENNDSIKTYQHNKEGVSKLS